MQALHILEKTKSISSISVLKQKKEIVDSDLRELTQKRSQLSYMDEYKAELNSKRKISSQIDELQEKAQLVEFEISTIEESIKNYAKINLILIFFSNLYFSLNNLYILVVGTISSVAVVSQ